LLSRKEGEKAETEGGKKEGRGRKEDFDECKFN
jgi:hypothetical protein